MEIAVVGLVVLALIVFFVLKKKKPSESDIPKVKSSALDSGSSAVTSKSPPDQPSPQERRIPDVSGSTEWEPDGLTIEEQSAAATTIEESALDDDGAPPSPPSDAAVDQATPGSEKEASPPPPPARDKLGTPSPVSVGRKSELTSLRKGLARSRAAGGFFGKLKDLFGSSREIDPTIAAEIEEILLTSDVGVTTTEAILDRIKVSLDRGDLKNETQVWETLRDEARRTLSVDGKMGGIALSNRPTVVLMVGVNGAGKTTTIGKLAAQFIHSGKSVMLAAGDTFRAAAVDQLQAWGDRVGCEVVSGKSGADPSSVLFDAIRRAEESGVDVLLADTAGRLHTKTNLMQEMAKIAKTLDKALPGAPHEVLLVIDSTNGQNAMAQAKEFKAALGLTGLVLTKLDGTARGGAVLGICDGLQVPVRYIGVGERTEDLMEFDTNAFVEALLGSDENEIAA